MGICQSQEQKMQKDVDKKLKDEFILEQKVIKLLLLGSAGGGKSTLLKQMRILHANGYKTEEECMKQREHVFYNLLMAVKKLLDGMDELGIIYEQRETEAVNNLSKLAALMVEYERNPIDASRLIYDSAFVAGIKTLWADPAVHQQLLPRINELQCTDNASYFINAIDRIVEKNYVPTVQDILLLRIPTVGIVEIAFKINQNNFRVFDVGGQRSERRKWIHCFDNAHAIIFIAAVNEFDQVLEEDNRTNRLIESMHVFRSICNSKFFLTTAIILFLNKKDLFEQKILVKTIQCLFRNYRGDNSYADQMGYVKKKFEVLNGNQNKDIYTHETCATDTTQIEHIMKSVIDLITTKIIAKSGIY